MGMDAGRKDYRPLMCECSVEENREHGSYRKGRPEVYEI